MSKFTLSENFKQLLTSLKNDVEFKKLHYYMRCLKKAHHGGVFDNSHQSQFLKYYPIQTYTFLKEGQAVPYPVVAYKPKLKVQIYNCDVKIEELLTFCFCVDKENRDDLIFGTTFAGDKIYSAMASGVLSLKVAGDYCFEDVGSKAVDGQLDFLDYFDYDYSRLLEVFLLFTLRIGVVNFFSIDDVQKLENLDQNSDKYGLTDISSAVFERQGFIIDKNFYLYNIFFDTSIGGPNSNVPLTIEIIKKIPNAILYMRKDETLSVSSNKIVTSATHDMQKYRGITLNFDSIEMQIKQNKEVIVHWNPANKHKVLVVIRPSETKEHEAYYNIGVEGLWSIDSICTNEDVVITNFIHGCYYPKKKSFDHIDFSVNQYCKDLYLKKYVDSIAKTTISIEQYSNLHYKVWCVKGGYISLQIWAELVMATLDLPFRDLFLETIGAKISE